TITLHQIVQRTFLVQAFGLGVRYISHIHHHHHHPTMEGRYGSDDEVELSLREQWNMLIEKDLDLIWKIRIYVNESWFQPYIDKVVSSNPFADISMLTWFSFIIAVTEFGFPFLWICTGNLFFAQVLRWTLGCR
ncbi:unnamed protein product, partial [Heterosigma akashiwo]